MRNFIKNELKLRKLWEESRRVIVRKDKIPSDTKHGVKMGSEGARICSRVSLALGKSSPQPTRITMTTLGESPIPVPYPHSNVIHYKYITHTTVVVSLGYDSTACFVTANRTSTTWLIIKAEYQYIHIN